MKSGRAKQVCPGQGASSPGFAAAQSPDRWSARPILLPPCVELLLVPGWVALLMEDNNCLEGESRATNSKPRPSGSVDCDRD